MKYIDADKLIAEIDKKWEELADKNVKVGGGKYDIEISTYLSIKTLIISLQQERPKEICFKCIYYGKDDGYCYYPHGGMQSKINENGVYECTGFYEKEQEQPEVDLEKEFERWIDKLDDKYYMSIKDYSMRDMKDTASHFYELGKNSK